MIARVASAEAGVKRAQASYTRWESEYKRLQILVNQRVLDVQVRDETYRQSRRRWRRATRRRRPSPRRTRRTTRRGPISNAPPSTSRPPRPVRRRPGHEREARVIVEYGRIKAPYPGVITQRNVSPGDYLQPGGGTNGRPLFVLEQTDPVRIFVGVPELASFFVKDGDTALIRFQAIPGATREGKVVRSGFSLNPTTRTVQTEIDVPNPEGYLRPGWYVTVTIVVDRKQVWVVPSNAIHYMGQQDYAVFMQINDKPVRVPVIVGPSDDTYTEILRKLVPGDPKNPPYANTVDWPTLDGTENILVGNLDILNQEATDSAAKGSGEARRLLRRRAGPDPDLSQFMLDRMSGRRTSRSIDEDDSAHPRLLGPIRPVDAFATISTVSLEASLQTRAVGPLLSCRADVYIMRTWTFLSPPEGRIDGRRGLSG